MTKTCTKCLEDKDVSFFHRDKSASDGLRRWCKSCAKAVRKVYRSRNLEAIRERDVERAREYRRRNSDLVRERDRERYRRDPEKRLEGQRDWRRRNPDYYTRRAEAARESSRRWREQNPDKRREYYRANKNRYLEYFHQRQARKANLPSEKYTRWEIFDRDGWVCYLCEKPVLRFVITGRHPEGPSIEHVVPLSYEGVDNPGNVRSNVKLAHLRCNMRKHNKHERDA